MLHSPDGSICPLGHGALSGECKYCLLFCNLGIYGVAAMRLLAVTMHERQKDYTLSQAINLTLLIHKRANQLSWFCLGKFSSGGGEGA